MSKWAKKLAQWNQRAGKWNQRAGKWNAQAEIMRKIQSVRKALTIMEYILNTT